MAQLETGLAAPRWLSSTTMLRAPFSDCAMCEKLFDRVADAIVANSTALSRVENALPEGGCGVTVALDALREAREAREEALADFKYHRESHQDMADVVERS